MSNWTDDLEKVQRAARADDRWGNWLATQRHVSKVVDHYEGLLLRNRIGCFIAGMVVGILALYFGMHA